MGVLGLAPFLQRTCPEVVKTLPERLSSLSGKRVVIDGTLITQRFHFAPIPHPARHVLGWYRLIKHLQASNVQTICVFDGRERSAAKGQEVERRRKDRMLTAVRGAFEAERLSRLRRLRPLLQSWRLPGGASQAAQQLALLKDNIGKLDIPLSVVIPPVRATVKHLEAENTILDRHVHPNDVGTNLDMRAVPESQTSLEYTAPSTDVSSENPSLDLNRLYEEYHHSIPRILSLTELATSQSSHELSATTSVTTEEVGAEEVEDAKLEGALSKSQHGLTLDEGRLWNALANTENPEDAEDIVKCLVEELESKSALLSESYARRTHGPTYETYAQSKEILHAMGVPCIEPSGPYEAEALAASLVINGYADYVASEDTDVLVYEAPLLRNIASSTGPLVLISGADVRAVLQLDRARYIDFALLLGTDFSQRIKNVGPARALKFIREYGSIERVLEHERGYPPRMPPDEYLQQVELARSVFQTLPPTPDEALLERGDVNEEAVWAILDRHNLHRYVAEDRDYGQALAGNYFSDNPAAS
ncbi:PIN domain-like protein [Trametes polyzona]|nr:PIN domain-like protein [Trametes polyzona]